VPARSSIAIHTGQKLTGAGTGTITTASPTAAPTASAVQVNFAATVTTTFGENIFVSGDIAQLGKWATGSSVSLALGYSEQIVR
jgi:alpha-amylase